MLENQEQTTPPEYSPVELKAMEMGWRPKEDFHGDEVDFVDAKEFVGRQPLFDKISHQTKEIKQVKEALEAFKTHYTTVREVEYQRALGELKKARKTALSEGDGDKFDEIDDEIKTVERQVSALKATQGTPVVQEQTVHPDFERWVNANPWYNSTGYMKAFADDVGTRLAAKGLTPAQVLKEVEQAVREEFPNKFRNPNKEGAPPVESGAPGGSRRGREPELTDQERKIMNTLVSSGTMTKEKYLADLKAIKERG